MQETKETQVVIYASYYYKIGGIETFVLNFCKYFCEKYDILVLYEQMDEKQRERLIPLVEVMKNDKSVKISCDTLISNRIHDELPENVCYKKSVQMVHCIKQLPEWKIPQDRDYIVNVSYASRNSFGEEAFGAVVINNILYPERVQKSLILVSAMRVGAEDKQGNDDRCRKLCHMMQDAGIYYKWLYFGDKKMLKEPDGMIYCGCDLDIKPYIKAADYVVQLSGSEAFSYTMLESLSLNTPLICTPLEQNDEMFIRDGENAYVVPFDMEFDVRKILDIPQFKYELNDKPLLNDWMDILGDPHPKGLYDPNRLTKVRILRRYFDLELQREVVKDEVIEVSYIRANKLMYLGFGIIERS